MKNHLRYDRLGSLLLFLLAAACLLSAVLGSNQAALSRPLQQTFVGSYSRDGVNWAPLDDRADLSALDGDLILRGHLTEDILDGGCVTFYRDHIGVSIYRDGERLYIDTITEFREYGLALLPALCGREWNSADLSGVTAADELEIRLMNPHAHGNADAYRTFLNTLYNTRGSSYLLEQYLQPYSLPLQIGGIVLLIAALMLLGAALAAELQRVPIGGLWQYGASALFMGGFILLDTVNLSFFSKLVVFNTYGRQLCFMLAVHCVGLCVCGKLTGKPKKVAAAAMWLSALVNGVLIALSCTGVMVLYDTGIYWAAAQVVLCPLLIGCAIAAARQQSRRERVILFGFACILCAVLLDIAGVQKSMYSHGTCMKAVCVLVFVCYAVDLAKRVVIDHQASIRAKQLEKELVDSRIATLLSQIQPHFIYNTLGTVEQLCKEQPETAAKLVHDFSCYLRGNFRELDRTTPILLSKEMEHVQHYVNIEHVRFPDMEVRFELHTDDFLLPALSVQPLVENAIKHGLMGLESGGTVTVSSYETERDYCVSVVDDGVGFDPSMLQEDRKHIGIRNIRGRIEAMCGGTLTVESAPGKGTRAVITIPKEGEQPL